ncbi:MAG TPA: beta-galactosidase [Chloroflexota bacterium]
MTASIQRRLGRLVLLGCLVFSALQSIDTPRAARAQITSSHTVTWDSHSLLIDGKRILLYGGEFHYWRLPSPQLWTDRLEKMKAAGLNAVSIYFDWQYHSNAPGKYDFTGIRDVDRLLSIADRLGLYVLARVGPYMNAEVDAGGLPGWLLREPLYPRNQSWNGTTAVAQYSPLYEQYAKVWFDHILPIVARHQVTNGGSVVLLQIENEYSQDTGSVQYMQDLYSYARADGIKVPIFHNDYWFKGDWSKQVDLYAFDSYPYGFACCHQWWDTHFRGIDTWENTLRSVLAINTPMFVSELQGGAFDPWGGVGYSAVAATLDGDWLSALDESALAQGTTLLNTYMFVGGTTWGYMSEPGVYSSYDYGAPISESGALRPAYYSAHRLGLFLQSFGADLAGADAAPAIAQASNPQVVVHARTSTQSGNNYIFLRHGDAGPSVTTSLSLALGNRRVDIPQKPGTAITMPGHGSALLLSNADTGPLHLNYSTSQVLTQANTAQGPYLVLYGPDGSAGETDFALPSTGITVQHNADVQVVQSNGELRLNYIHGSDPRTVSIQSAAGTLRLIITSTPQASHFWVDNNLLIYGPDLVTDSTAGMILRTGNSRGARVYGAPSDRSLLLDGHLSAVPDSTMGSILLGSLDGAPQLTLPSLTNWKFQAEPSQADPALDDSTWTLADHTSTTNPNVPPTSTLLADDYGFHYGYVWYRGHFTTTGSEAFINIMARQRYSVYLNGTLLGSANESLKDPPHPYAEVRTFDISPNLLRPGQDNVVSVLTESLGHDEGWIAGQIAQSPQGLLSATLSDAVPIVWRLQGDLGGESPADTQRGIMNASGLYGERNGWYFPSFDDSAWQTVPVPDNWKARSNMAAIGWYRTHFALNEPAHSDTPLGLSLPHAQDIATIWVNGWLIGRYWEQKGPQHLFYVPDGVLNPRGDNTLAIAVWNWGNDGGLTAQPALSQYPSLSYHVLSEAPPTSTPATDYWHTAGNRIVDSANRPVRIAAANWFGGENRFFVPAGLDKQSLDSIVARVKQLGLNAIRLPFSNQMVEENPVVTAHLDANPDLQGLHALDIMDRIIAAAGRQGIRVILDDGRSSVGTQPEPNGLWYTSSFPESVWLADWEALTRRYAGNATVIGADVRNEPHTAPPGPWSISTYLHQGATWGPYKGIENPATDWRLAAERVGDAILAINPRLLIFVEGIQQYPNPTWTDGIESYWWGGILYPAKQYPVVLDVPHQLVYSPHEYGPLKWQMPFFGPKMTYQSLAAVWDAHWGFLEKPSAGAGEAPIFIGEFGTCGTQPSCFEDAAAGSQGLWFSYFMRYLKEHPEIGWSYWALNGTSHLGDPMHDYLLKPDWKSINRPQLVNTLHDIEIPAPPVR